MNLNYTIPSKIIVDMRHNIQETIHEYPHEINKNVACPWNGKLFENTNDEKE